MTRVASLAHGSDGRRALLVGRARRPTTSATTTRSGGGRCATTAASTSGWCSRASSPASRGSRSCASARTSGRPSPASTSRRWPRFGERDVARLLADAGIVRHRGKIEAAIANAVAARAMHADGESLAELIWSYAPERAPARAARARRPAGDHARVDGAEQGAEAARLPLRRPHDRLRDDAGLRRRQRPPGRLLGAGGGRGTILAPDG